MSLVISVLIYRVKSSNLTGSKGCSPEAARGEVGEAKGRAEASGEKAYSAAVCVQEKRWSAFGCGIENQS